MGRFNSICATLMLLRVARFKKQPYSASDPIVHLSVDLYPINTRTNSLMSRSGILCRNRGLQRGLKKGQASRLCTLCLLSNGGTRGKFPIPATPMAPLGNATSSVASPAQISARHIPLKPYVLLALQTRHARRPTSCPPDPGWVHAGCRP